MTVDAVDYAVVGAGLAGASTAWRLAQARHRVALVERDVPASSQGSSHGSARIFRYAYPDAFYTRLVQDSEAGWAELQAAAGLELIRRTGCVDFGGERQPEQLAAVFAECGVEHELLGAAAASERFGGFAFDSDVLWHPSAGVIDAESSVNAMVAQAVAHGAELLTGWPVASVSRRGAGFMLRAADGRTLEAGHVIVAAGGWLPRLLSGLDLPAALLASLPEVTVMQETAFHFPYRDQEQGRDVEQARAWPTSIHKSSVINTYSLPGGRDAGFRGQKLAEYNGGRRIADASVQDGVIDPAHRERIIAYVGEHLPGLVPEPYAESTCLFTNTPGEDFLIDTADGVTIVSPCSGHGAKFAPLIGELAAGLATGAADVPARFRASTAGKVGV